MNEFLDAALTMPTLIFSILLIPVALYWLTVILGFMDLGIIDGIFDLFEGWFGGAAEGVEGMFEGAAEGVAEGLEPVEGSGCLGLAGVPLTIIGSAFIVFGWVFSYGGTALLGDVLAGTALIAGVGVGAVALSLAVTAVALRPLRKAFHIAPVTGRRDLVGRICTVKTLRVDERFGQAEVEDDGAPILIQARAARPNTLRRGERALIFEYDPVREVFLISPLDDHLAKYPGGKVD